MNKSVIAGMALAVCIVSAAAPSPSSAIEFGIGVNGMYDMWLPVYKRLHVGEPCRVAGYNLKHDNDGSFMLGPELGIYTEDLKICVSALFGVTRNSLEYSSIVWDPSVWYIYPQTPQTACVVIGDGSARRYDADLKIAKALNDLFNINFGARFNYGGGDGSQFRLHMPLDFNFGEDTYHIWQVGPEIGIGFNYSNSGFTIYIDVNGLVNGGNNYLERKLVLPRFLPCLLPFKYDGDFLGFGFDTDIGASYYIEQAHMLIGIGFRWVGVVCVSLENDDSVLDLSHRNGWMTGYWDHFYGLTFTVGFRF